MTETVQQAPRPASSGTEVEAVAPPGFLEALKKGFRAREKKEVEEVELTARSLTDRLVRDKDLISPNAARTIKALIARIDESLSKQVNEILHHQDFLKLESTWRGLHYLVRNSQTDQTLKIKILNISKDELADTMENFEGDDEWRESPLFNKIYTKEYSTVGGEAYGCIIGDYYFDHRPRDVGLLRNLSRVCAAAFVPFVSGASPELLGLDDWQGLEGLSKLEAKQQGPAFAAWRSLREKEEARFIALAMPRVVARLPYGPKTKPVKAFAFEEDITGDEHHKYCWMNAAFALGANVTRAFTASGWCSRIRGFETGGLVSDLPVHNYDTDDGLVAMKCPTEVSLDDVMDNELGKIGLLPIVHKKNTDKAAFIGGQTLQKPSEYDTDEATANARLSARLHYIFAVCRFAHYLKQMAMQKVGMYANDAEDVRKWLQRWLNQYIDPDPRNSSDAIKMQKPLADGKIVVQASEDNPGYFYATAYLRPHFQLEGLTASLRLVTEIPPAAK